MGRSLIGFVILLENWCNIHTFKLAGYSKLDNALLKLFNIKDTIRTYLFLLLLQEYLKLEKLFCRSVKLSL